MDYLLTHLSQVPSASIYSGKNKPSKNDNTTSVIPGH